MTRSGPNLQTAELVVPLTSRESDQRKWNATGSPLSNRCGFILGG